MLKLIFLLMIFITSSYLGFIYGETFKKRHNQLKEILKALSILEGEIMYGSTPLPEALDNISVKVREPLNKVIKNVKDRLIYGNVESVYEGFIEEFSELEDEFYFNESDKRVIGDFFKSLGDSGVYGQGKIFTLAIEEIKLNIEEANDIRKKNTKLYRYLGICFGAMVTIFLI